MQHAGDAEVLHVGECAGHLAGNIDSRNRLTDNLVVFRILHRGIGVDPQRKALAADEFSVGDLLARLGVNNTVNDGEVRLVGIKPRSRFLQQRVFGGRGRLPQLHAPDLDREAAPCRSLFRRERRIALDQRDRGEGHVEFFGDHLHQRGAHAGAEIDLAGIDGDEAFGVDREERVDFGERDRLGGSSRGALRERAIDFGELEADDERAAGLEEIAT